MRGFWTLFEKDVRLSLPWFFTNVAIVSLFVGLSVFYVKRGNNVGLLFLFLAGAGLFLWSIFAGIATYFNERDGRLYEFVNSLPVNRTVILLSKEVWLILQATLYFAILVVGGYLVMKISGSLSIFNVRGIEDLARTSIVAKGILAQYLRILTFLTSGIVSAALVKDLPLRWFFAVLMVMLISWAVGWLDLTPFLGVKGTVPGDPNQILRVVNLQLLNESLRFLATFLLLLLGGVWVERRGY